MNQLSENLWKRILGELTEEELSMVPPDEEIRETHIFSERFLRNMQPVLAMGTQESGSESFSGLRRNVERNEARKMSDAESSDAEFSNTETSDTEPMKDGDTGKTKMSEFAGKVRGRQRRIRILAACIACALVFGVVLAAWRGTFSLRMGSSMDSSESADMAGVTEETADATDGAAVEESEAEESLAKSESVESGDGVTTASGQESAENGTGGEASDSQASGSTSETTGRQDSSSRMVMLDGKLYVDTGETSSIGRCGVMDFTLDSSVESGKPTTDGQTNFGIGYSGQYGTRANRIEVCINDVWHVFAYQENDLEDVSLTVESVTSESLGLWIRNYSDQELTFGQEYKLEKYDEEIDTWVIVPDVTDFAYEDIALVVEPGGDTRESVTADWAEKYATMEAGTYRVVKTVTVTDAPEGTGEHTLTQEFTID